MEQTSFSFAEATLNLALGTRHKKPVAGSSVQRPQSDVWSLSSVVIVSPVFTFDHSFRVRGRET